jgi:hypothetical protein
MKLICPDCSGSIKSDDVNITMLVAKCAHCDSVFSFAGHFMDVDPGHRPAVIPEPEHVDLALPKGLHVNNDGDRLTITRRWFTCAALPILGFAALWDLFLVFWYVNVMSVDGMFSVLAMIFPLLHVAVGVSMTYYGIANVLNRTEIVVDKETIEIAHGPIPWRGGRTVHTAAVKQLYVHREEKRKRNSTGMTETFSVHALLADHASVPLVTGLKSRFQALYIEQEIERQLGIEAVHVKGEYLPAPHELRSGRARPVGVSLSLAESDQDELSMPSVSDD